MMTRKGKGSALRCAVIGAGAKSKERVLHERQLLGFGRAAVQVQWLIGWG
jgi:hypothetical protein